MIVQHSHVRRGRVDGAVGAVGEWAGDGGEGYAGAGGGARGCAGIGLGGVGGLARAEDRSLVVFLLLLVLLPAKSYSLLMMQRSGQTTVRKPSLFVSRLRQKTLRV